MTTMNWVGSTKALWVIWALYWTIMARSAAKTETAESVAARAGHLLPLAAGYFLLYWPTPYEAMEYRFIGPEAVWSPLGAILAMCGFALAVWARNHLGKYWSGIITLKEGHQLIRTGPYRLVRHPIYTGVLLAFLGSAMAVGRGRGLVAFFVVTVAFGIKAKREERNLLSRFGDEYRLFQREVKALLPRIY